MARCGGMVVTADRHNAQVLGAAGAMTGTEDSAAGYSSYPNRGSVDTDSRPKNALTYRRVSILSPG